VASSGTRTTAAHVKKSNVLAAEGIAEVCSTMAAALEVDVPRTHVGQVIGGSGSHLAAFISHMQATHVTHEINCAAE
jgi:hypothetical protein